MCAYAIHKRNSIVQKALSEKNGDSYNNYNRYNIWRGLIASYGSKAIKKWALVAEQATIYKIRY